MKFLCKKIITSPWWSNQTKKISIGLSQISINENIEVEEYTVGYIHIPPFDSEKLSEIEVLREKVIEFLKEYTKNNNK